jgi:steroid delta-isomerase-like uncharacterized protein
MNLAKRFFCVLFLFFVASTASAQNAVADTTARYLLFSQINAWTMHNADAIDDIFNKNAVYEDVAYGAVMHGKYEIKNFLRETFNDIPDFTVKIVNWFSCGNKLSCELIMSGTLTKDTPDTSATGKPFSVRGTSVATIKDGKFERWTDYYDK